MWSRSEGGRPFTRRYLVCRLSPFVFLGLEIRSPYTLTLGEWSVSLQNGNEERPDCAANSALRDLAGPEAQTQPWEGRRWLTRSSPHPAGSSPLWQNTPLRLEDTVLPLAFKKISH